jgi:hypothetical protein
MRAEHNVTAGWVGFELVLYSRQVMGSNLGPETGYPDYVEQSPS